MSTIASPRDSSVNDRRAPLISTPTGSSRPSLENPRSNDASPSRAPAQPARRNRAALREYYNLRAASAPVPTESETSSIHDFSEVQESELDSPSFDYTSYVKTVLEGQSLAELLRTYNAVLTDIRALDAEKKALVYDNYSKLIAATETIRKMRVGMDPLNPMARALDPVIKEIYGKAEGMREELRNSLSEEQRRVSEMGDEEKDEVERRVKGRKVALKILEAPERVRGLVEEGKMEEARCMWEAMTLVLERWAERGVGGEDVQACIDDGEAALKGDPPNERSWVNVKKRKVAES